MPLFICQIYNIFHCTYIIFPFWELFVSLHLQIKREDNNKKAVKGFLAKA